MAKLQRYYQKIFGINSVVDNIGVFGSMAAGSPATSKAPDTIQSLAQFESGWTAAILGDNSPAIEDVNSLDYLETYQLAYIFQSGIPEWDPSTPYYSGSFAVSGGLLYYSVSDSNLNKDPATQIAYWIPYDTIRSGTVVPFAGTSIPIGYLLCDGSAVSRTTYANLFAAISIQTACTTGNGSKIVAVASSANMVVGMPVSGTNVPAGALVESVDSSVQIHITIAATGNGSTTLVVAPYGIGDGSTTFNVPDLRGRVIAGRDDMGGSAAGRLTTAGSVINGILMGASGGSQNVVLSATQIPAHTHAFSGTTSGQSATHAHTFRFFSFDFNANTGDGGSGVIRVTGVTDAANTGNANADHSHTYSGTTGNGTGGGLQHLNAQPTAIMNYMVKI